MQKPSPCWPVLWRCQLRTILFWKDASKYFWFPVCVSNRSVCWNLWPSYFVDYAQHTHTQKTSSKNHNLISSWNRQQCHAHTVLTWSCIRRWLTITVAFLLQVFVHWKLVLRSDLTKEAIQKLSDDNFLSWLIWRQAITHIPGVTHFLQETHLCSCHPTELQTPILHWTILVFQSGKHISPELSVFLE